MSVHIREKKLSDGRTSLYLDVYYKGQRSYEFLDLYLTKDKLTNDETWNFAKTIRAQRELDIRANKENFIPTSRGKINFIQYFQKIADEKKDCSFNAALKKLKDYAGDELRINNINEKWLEDYKRFLLNTLHTRKSNKVIKNNTAWLYFNKLNYVLRRARMEKLIASNPGDFVKKISKHNSEKTYLTYDELKKLAKTNCRNQEVRRAFLFSCYTSLRWSDVKKLTWGEIKDGKIIFSQKKIKGSMQYVPLNETAIDLIKPSGNIINHPEKLVFDLPSWSMAYLLIKIWAADAGIQKNITYHVSRHTFAVSSLSKGVNLKVLSNLMGHASVSTTEIYATITDPMKQEAVNLLPKLEVK